MPQLPFTTEAQLQDQWCWSAASISTSRFYNAQTTWSQCRLVNSELRVGTCCQNGSSSTCNKPWYLDRALRRTANLNRVESDAVSRADVLAEIESDRPLCARVGWRGGGGHFVVISGIVGDIVTIDDPWEGGRSLMPYDEFRDNYQNDGEWTHSYFTQA
jgi:hypothetical protein